ncbi:MAG TPA: hypothetical protein VGL18_17475 [Actinomycetota bacterium]|jgi:hypothetical protein
MSYAPCHLDPADLEPVLAPIGYSRTLPALSPQESTLYQFLTMTARGSLDGGAAKPQTADVRLAQESTIAGKGGA